MNPQTDIPIYCTITIWLAINIYVFTSTYLEYAGEKKFFYLKYIIKGGLPVARGAAAVLQFNCLLVLLPVCRNLLSFIKNIPSLPKSVSRLLDKNISFHKIIAYTICAATAVHVGAHVFNFEHLVSSWSGHDVISGYLNLMEDRGKYTRLNPVRREGVDPVIELLKSQAGLTGVIITLVLIVMVSSSTEYMRRSYFEVFWFTHHLFVIFFIGLVLHGFGYLLRFQDNVGAHNPKVCVNYTLWEKKGDKCEIPPHFSKSHPNAWKWVVVPLCLYFVEKCIRFYRSLQPCAIKKVVKHPSRVLELQLRKVGFRADPGQYVFLQCSAISKFEWHPFTLTSCPEEDFFSVHIRVVGDWTEQLATECEQDVPLKLNIACDGPFGTASSDIFRYETVVCVGAGIGVTPFASVLKSIWYRQQKNNAQMKVKKVYFFWICPETSAFEWFADLLLSLESEMSDKGLADMLEYNIYLTRGWKETDVWNIAIHDSEAHAQDSVTGLNQKTNFGRPDWDAVFTRVRDVHNGSKIGVFFCGPPVLSQTLSTMSSRFSDKETRFVYNKENF